MTRFAVLGCLVLALGARGTVAEDKKDTPKELAPFQGTWKVVKAEVDGTAIAEKEFEAGRFTFEGTKLTVLENEKTKPDVGTYKVNTEKEPYTIDLIQAEGEKALGLYKFDKDGKLTMCFVKGKDAVRPKGFDDKKVVVIVLEKVKK